MARVALEYDYKADIIKFPIEYQEDVINIESERRKTKKVSATERLYSDKKIIAVRNVFKKYLGEAKTFVQERATRRNPTMYICTVEISLQDGDFCSLRWDDIYNPDWTFNQGTEFIPQKASKCGKKVNLIWGTNFRVTVSERLN